MRKPSKPLSETGKEMRDLFVVVKPSDLPPALRRPGPVKLGPLLSAALKAK